MDDTAIPASPSEDKQVTHCLLSPESKLEEFDVLGPPPEGLTVQEIADESVTWADEYGNRFTIYGKVLYVSGAPALVNGWLSGKTVWTSLAPITGKWKAVTFVAFQA